jgi:hypothetical protein
MEKDSLDIKSITKIKKGRFILNENYKGFDLLLEIKISPDISNQKRLIINNLLRFYLSRKYKIKLKNIEYYTEKLIIRLIGENNDLITDINDFMYYVLLKYKHVFYARRYFNINRYRYYDIKKILMCEN